MVNCNIEECIRVCDPNYIECKELCFNQCCASPCRKKNEICVQNCGSNKDCIDNCNIDYKKCLDGCLDKCSDECEMVCEIERSECVNACSRIIIPINKICKSCCGC